MTPDDTTAPAIEPLYGLCATFDPVAPAGQPSTTGARAVFLKGKRWDLGQTVAIRFLDGSRNLWDLVETFALPSTFRLAIAGEGEAHVARIIWRKPDEMGVILD